ncbi:DUF7563 family protein [Haloglomus litoreum]|uniref:DUF7563 family protein n=1 Tax=Haloglomus litoreum TaxID=3034026 RepID=UPI0023E7CF08|nr:hypothetical protein [Haloglomus sp. DT116]
MMSLDSGPTDDTTGAALCRDCGTYVSKRFARVFGDNEHRVYGCPSCSTFRERSEGGATDSDAKRWWY